MKPHTPMTKSPRAVAREALALARESLPAYSAVRSRKDFTQHQLFAILALKIFLKTDYRGVVAFLGDFAEPAGPSTATTVRPEVRIVRSAAAWERSSTRKE